MKPISFRCALLISKGDMPHWRVSSPHRDRIGAIGCVCRSFRPSKGTLSSDQAGQNTVKGNLLDEVLPESKVQAGMLERAIAEQFRLPG